MAVNYTNPFGPTLDPDYGLSSWGFYDDFIGLSESATEHAARWFNVSTTGTSVASASDPFGAVAITNGTVTAEDGGIQLAGEPIAFNRSKDMIFGVRLKASSITGGNIFVGLHEEVGGGAFDVGSGSALIQNHIGFSANGVASIFFDTADGSSQTRTDTTADLVASTYVLLVGKYNALASKWYFYVNGVLKGTHDLDSTYVPADGTQLTLGLHNEFQTAASTLTVDYVYVFGVR